MLKHYRALLNKGVMGINKRNGDYILAYNPRHLYPLVDDKLRTKKLATEKGLGVPELYGVVEIVRQAQDLPKLLSQYEDFVIKPAHGSGGEGILIISGRRGSFYRKPNGLLLKESELVHHVVNILSGMYSLGGHPDSALIEYRIQVDPVLESISFQGVPDIRIIVFMGVPVLSMVRLPTRIANGKANLHQGAIGAGVNIATGTTLNAVWFNDVVTEHPDTGHKISGVQIPYWDTLLSFASSCYDLTGLGYQGVDIVLDKKKGPLILELNARPGLNIQIANMTGLSHRLQRVEAQHHGLHDTEARVAFAKQHFSV